MIMDPQAPENKPKLFSNLPNRPVAAVVYATNCITMLKLLPILLIAFFLNTDVQAQCNASFDTTINGATIQLQAVDTTPYKIHIWNFGDGTQGWGVHTSHTYNSPGTYVVHHIVTDSLHGCLDSARQTITISFPVSCSASFVAARDSSYPYKYHFYSNSTANGGSIQSWNWMVDGSTVSAAPAFNGSLPQGLHAVCLTIQTTAGCTSAVCDSIRVDSGGICNISASFTATPAASNPAQISFTPSPLNSSLSYTWIFGDGQVSYSQSPIHVYSSPGSYHVTLSVEDSTGHCYDSVSHNIYIQGIPQDSCTASFDTSINGATAQLQAVDTTPYKIHKWYFGDGTQGWGAHIFHTYNLPGTYVVKHIITDSLSNCRDSAWQTITISFPVSCSASFVAARDSSYPYKNHFYSTSTANGGNIQSWNWTVNGSTVSTAPAFSWSLPQGLHAVCLTIQTTAGCTSAVCDSIRVDSGGICNISASFTATPAASNPAQISFTPSPLNSSLSYTWIFGDGQVSYSQSPIHVYSSPGSYHVTLSVEDSTGHCYDSVSHNIYIQGIPQDSCTASFTYTANPSQPNQLTFTAISNETIVSQFWFIRPCDSLTNSSDSLVYNTPNPVHTFTNPGCYQVCVSLLTNTGCRKNYCDTVIIQNTGGARLLTSFPNPASGADVNIRLDLEQAEKVKLTVFNSYGHMVYTSERAYASGQNRIGIPVNKLPRGLYYVDIQYGNSRKRSVFQKL